MKIKGKDILFQVLLYAVFAFYLFLLAAILFRSHPSTRSVNLIPFRGIVSYLTVTDFVSNPNGTILSPSFAFENLLGNIVIFIPLGVYITLFNKDKRLWKNLLLIILASFGAEVLQVIFKLGVGDIDDVILNGIGGLIGILLYKLLYRLCKEELLIRRIVAVAAPIIGILCFFLLILYSKHGASLFYK